MRLSEMTQNQFLKTAYSRHKTVAICEFEKIQSPISEIVGCIILLF